MNLLLSALLALLILIPDISVHADDIFLDQVTSTQATPQQAPEETGVKYDTAIQEQITQCWNRAQIEYKEAVPPVPHVTEHLIDNNGNTISITPTQSAPDTASPINVITKIDNNGRVLGIRLDQNSVTNANTYPAYHAVTNTAIYAVKICSPFRNVKKPGIHVFTFSPDYSIVRDSLFSSPSQQTHHAAR